MCAWGLELYGTKFKANRLLQISRPLSAIVYHKRFKISTKRIFWHEFTEAPPLIRSSCLCILGKNTTILTRYIIFASKTNMIIALRSHYDRIKVKAFMHTQLRKNIWMIIQTKNKIVIDIELIKNKICILTLHKSN